MVRDGDPVGIPAEILKNGFGAVEGGLAIDHPVFRIESAQKGGKVLPHTVKFVSLVSFFEKVQEFPFKQR